MIKNLLIACLLVFSGLNDYDQNTVQNTNTSNEVVNQNDLFLTNFATQYFSHLDDNRSFNLHGSCGYVAISLFLSFYDTFWNDELIPENYDQISTSYDVSPGVKGEQSFLDYTEADLYNFIVNETYVNDYFQFLLFKIGYDGGYITYSNSGLDTGVNNEEMDYVLETYLYDEDYLDAYQYDYFLDTIDSNDGTSTTSDDVKSFAINYVKNGFPVIIGYPGHVSVAYDYDILTNKLYGYMGWTNSGFHSEYTNFSDSWAIALSRNHSHSNNYYINGEYLCACQTPFHIHDYDYNFVSNNSATHKAFCHCGSYILENHTLVERIIAHHHYLCCTKCTYTRLNEGNTPIN